MSMSPPINHEQLERMLEESEAKASALRHIYVATRTATMSSLQKKHVFELYLQTDGLTSMEDEDLNVEIIHELDQTQSTLKKAREDLLQAERIAGDIRRAMRQE
jgi:C4-dicarboxylate-specific signal transduction histidine kinase